MTGNRVTRLRPSLRISPYLYVLPSILVLLAFMYLPVARTIQYSFFTFRNFIPTVAVGFANYRAIFRDPTFWSSIALTLKWVVMTALLPGFFGLVLALLIEQSGYSRTVAGATRTILFIPMMMSLVAVGLMWTLIYNPLLGLLNATLKLVGLVTSARPFNVFGDTRTALYYAFVPVIWQGSGFAMVIFAAALQGIPLEILEASIIDGASRMTQIVRIILPLIFRTITITVVINMISGFKAFDLLKVLTGGGPAASTEITSLYMYRKAFFAFDFGNSSAIAVVLFAIVLVCALGTNSLVDRLNRRFES